MVVLTQLLTILRVVWRLLAGVVLGVAAAVVLAVVALMVAVGDLWPRRRGVEKSLDAARKSACATIVIPNWNGKDLLEKYLPSVVDAGADEVIVVDNGSTDGSAAFVRDNFPQVRVLALETNLGFGGGSNAGIRAAKTD